MKNYENMVVIFVDLLGTKNNTDFQDKFFIHRLFHGEAKTNEERNLNHVIYDRKVYSFSDCAYFFYYYKDGIEDSRKDDMKLIQIAMSNTSLSLLRILNAGYLVRGGVAFGNAYFDELVFFGSAVEEAYELESDYADVPVIALSQQLGKKYYEWEASQTDMEIVELFFNSRPLLVEKDEDKYFLNMFYQLETFNSSLIMEHDIINIEQIKNNLFNVIRRDKEKYQNKCTKNKRAKSTIFEKLDWFEKYLQTKENKTKSGIIEGGISSIVCGD